jgi:hypothetical protein
VRSRRLIALTILVLALTPGWAAAGPGIYAQVLAVYQADGSVPPCQFTSAQLQQALKGVDTYGQQYFADFTDAVQTALASRASGACVPGGPRFSGQPNQAANQFSPPSITAASNANLPAPMLILGALTMVLGAAGGLVLLARARGWDPRWAAAVRHGIGEAGYRALDAWARLVARSR